MTKFNPRKIGRDAAIALAETKWWEGKSATEIATFGMEVAELCCPWSVFHEAIEKALGRPVYTHEFGLNPAGLLAELYSDKPSPTFQEIVELIPSEKRILIMVDG